MPRPSRWLPFLVPVVGAVAILSFMRPDAIVARSEIPFTLKWLVYDESDLTAFALRGANAADGRLPGRADEPEWVEKDQFADHLDGYRTAKSERFYFEYPLPTLLYFRLPYFILGPPSLPAAIADCHQYAVGQFVPRDDAARSYYRALRSAVRFDVIAATLALIALMAVLGFGYQSNGEWNRNVWLAALPGTVYFSLNRFDVFPTLTTAIAFACLGRGRRGCAGAFLAAGVLLKLYPVLFVPVIVRYLGIRPSSRFLVMFAATVGIGFGLSWALTDWRSLVGPIRVQLGRELEEGWTLYGKLFPTWLGRTGWARLLIVGLVTAGCLARKPDDLDGVLRRCGIILVAFVVLAVFWSPQWLLWFLPILIPLARTDRRIAFAAVAVDLVNYFSFPLIFWVLWNSWPITVLEPLVLFFTLTRGMTWLTLAILLARRRASRPRTLSGEMLANLCRDVLNGGNQSGKPRGLTWTASEVNGEPVYHGDVCLVPFTVSFEPIPGSDMEDVPAARVPRPVTGVFRWVNGAWRLDRPPVFNLSPAQVCERLT